jgi:hypothetical protein
MDETHIQQLAKQHLQLLEAARIAAAAREGPTPAAVWDRNIDAIIGELDRESQAYCTAYNAAIGSEKLVCRNDEAGINVVSGQQGDGARLHLNPRRRCLDKCFVSVGDIDERIPIEIRHAEDALVLLLNGEPASAAEAIAYLLDSFTAQLTQAECEAL